MPIGIGLGTAIAGIVAGGATVTAGVMGSRAAGHAGDLNAHAASEQLAYLQQKDVQDQRNWEATQAENRRQFDSTQALNIDQYNKKEARLAPYRSIGAGATGTLSDLLGIRMVPQPGGASVPPSSTSAPPSAATPSSAPPAASGGLPAIDPSKGNLGGQISSFFKSRGVTDAETPYWVEKWPELEARGRELNDPAYAQKRLAEAEALGGGGRPAPAASASRTSQPFSVMPGSTAPDLSSLYTRTAPLSAMGN